MNDTLTDVKELLKRETYSLVLSSNGNIYTSRQKGIRSLLELIGSGDFQGAYAADKIVGKAAAMLYVLLGVKAVYAEVMSEKAKTIFENNHIDFEYETLTDNIINRQGTGLCPMEEAVKEIENPNEAFEALKSKLNQLSDKKKG